MVSVVELFEGGFDGFFKFLGFFEVFEDFLEFEGVGVDHHTDELRDSFFGLSLSGFLNEGHHESSESVSLEFLFFGLELFEVGSEAFDGGVGNLRSLGFGLRFGLLRSLLVHLGREVSGHLTLRELTRGELSGRRHVSRTSAHGVGHLSLGELSSRHTRRHFAGETLHAHGRSAHGGHLHASRLRRHHELVERHHRHGVGLLDLFVASLSLDLLSLFSGE